MVDRRGRAEDDGRVTRGFSAERLLALLAVAFVVLAAVLAGNVRPPPGGDAWNDGAAGAWLWISAGLVPVVGAGVVVAARRTVGRDGRLVIGMAAAVTAATVVGESMHAADPPIDRGLLGALGVGLDVSAVVLAVGAVGTLLRPRAGAPGAARRRRRGPGDHDGVLHRLGPDRSSDPPACGRAAASPVTVVLRLGGRNGAACVGPRTARRRRAARLAAARCDPRRTAQVEVAGAVARDRLRAHRRGPARASARSCRRG